jgi:hypothetical protein
MCNCKQKYNILNDIILKVVYMPFQITNTANDSYQQYIVQIRKSSSPKSLVIATTSLKTLT